MFIPGLPSGILTAQQISVIEEAASQIWRYSFLLGILFSMLGILASQYRYLAGIMGSGPGVYAGRVCIVILCLVFYKLLLGTFLSIGSFLGVAILDEAGLKNKVPWSASSVGNRSIGNVLICQEILKQIKNRQVKDDEEAERIKTYEQKCQKILSDNQNSGQMNSQPSILTIPPLFASTGYELVKSFYYGAAGGIALISYSILQIINLIVYIVAVIFSIFWCFFIILLYVMGPVVIVAGLLPSFGQEMTMRWVYAVVQCSMWPPLIAIAIVLMSSFQTSYIEMSTVNLAKYLIENDADVLKETLKSFLITLGISFASLVIFTRIPFITAKLVPQSLATSLMNTAISKTAGSFLNKISR